MNSKFYDPSYGNTFATLDEIDNLVIDGYARFVLQLVNEADVGVDLNGDGDQLDQVIREVFQIQENPTGLQLHDNYFTY